MSSLFTYRRALYDISKRPLEPAYNSLMPPSDTFASPEAIPPILKAELSQVFDRAGITVPDPSVDRLWTLLKSRIMKEGDSARHAALEKFLKAGLLDFLIRNLKKFYRAYLSTHFHFRAEECVCILSYAVLGIWSLTSTLNRKGHQLVESRQSTWRSIDQPHSVLYV